MKRFVFGLSITLTLFCMMLSCSTSDEVVEPEKPDTPETPPQPTIITDTVVVHDTIYVHDTMVVRDTVIVGDTSPRILTFKLLEAQNTDILVSNVSCEIIDESLIEGWIPHLTSDKHPILRASEPSRSMVTPSPAMSLSSTSANQWY